MKIHESVFIRDLVIEKKRINYNSNVIPIKTSSSIEMTDLKYFEEVGELIY